MLNWIILIIASGFEIGWVMGIKYSHTILAWIVTFFCIVLSFVFLTVSTRRMSASIAYVFFVVFGTVGSYLIDVFYGKEMTFLSILSIIILLISIVELNKEENK